ncbi:DNA-binding protein [Cunninghamella echinulata]|nr:DNA-binding protein [Cunninghamella echinulata]
MENKNLVFILCDFLQVWIHQILYQRELYPLDTFEIRKFYDIPVYMNFHPKVCDYICQFIKAIKPMIDQGSCKSITILISSSSSSEIEKYVMEIEELDVAYSLVSTDISNLQYYFRSCLLKMNALPSLLPFHNSVDQQQFTLHLDLISPLSHHDREIITWVPTNNKKNKNEPVPWQQLIPIKTIFVHYLKINFFVVATFKKEK